VGYTRSCTTAPRQSTSTTRRPHELTGDHMVASPAPPQGCNARQGNNQYHLSPPARSRHSIIAAQRPRTLFWKTHSARRCTGKGQRARHGGGLRDPRDLHTVKGDRELHLGVQVQHISIWSFSEHRPRQQLNRNFANAFALRTKTLANPAVCEGVQRPALSFRRFGLGVFLCS